VAAAHLPSAKPREPAGARQRRGHAGRWHRTTEETHKWEIWPPEHDRPASRPPAPSRRSVACRLEASASPADSASRTPSCARCLVTQRSHRRTRGNPALGTSSIKLWLCGQALEPTTGSASGSCRCWKPDSVSSMSLRILVAAERESLVCCRGAGVQPGQAPMGRLRCARRRCRVGAARTGRARAGSGRPRHVAW
jgi:hypothetical protein